MRPCLTFKSKRLPQMISFQPVYVCVQYVCMCVYVLARGINPLAIKYSFLLQYLSLFVGFCRRCEPIVNTVN